MNITKVVTTNVHKYPPFETLYTLDFFIGGPSHGVYLLLQWRIWWFNLQVPSPETVGRSFSPKNDWFGSFEVTSHSLGYPSWTSPKPWKFPLIPFHTAWLQGIQGIRLMGWIRQYNALIHQPIIIYQLPPHSSSLKTSRRPYLEEQNLQ